jgi:uroporphyrinogen-III decarboxylase
MQRAIRERYPDRFICAYIDPGPFLIAFNLLGYDGLLLRLAESPEFVKELIRRIFDYQKELVLRWKEAGAHMINVIDEFAGTQGMMFAPELWRSGFKAMFTEFFEFVRDQDLFTGILLDGNIEALFDDLLEMPVDVVEFAQPLNIGLEKIAARFAGKRCVKASVDMMETLATGTPEQVRKEAHELVRRFHSDRGGFIAVALRWHRPEYPPVNVRASIEAFNDYRKARLSS